MNTRRILVIAMWVVLLAWGLMGLGAMQTAPWFSALALGVIGMGVYILYKGPLPEASPVVAAATAPRIRYLRPRDYQGMSCVYVLHDRTLSGWYKIGYTTNLTERIRQISKTKLPVQLHLGLVVVLPSSRPEATERMLHARFAHARRRGEWFELSPDDIEWLQRQMPQQQRTL